jgi:glyoxylase-like metal-dependent hydrolase (beta-lactamase superfamily II)
MNVQHVTRDAETFTCNAFLALGDRPTLVDAGAYDGVVDEIRRHTDDLDAVVLTHQHGDHVQQLDAVCEAFDPDVYAYDDHPLRTHELDDGDTVTVGDDEFEVVFTPGHAPDHVSLVSETALFSGDVVVHDDGAFDDGSFGRTDRPGQSRDRLLESIRDLLDRMPDPVSASTASGGPAGEHGERDGVSDERNESEARRGTECNDGVSEMYSGHGGVYEGDVRAVVERALERAERREPKYPDE